MISEDTKKAIVEVLKNHPEGLTLISLSEIAGLHRHTATKYVNELLEDGCVFQRSVGVAKLCYLKEKVENQSDEKKPIERPREVKTSNNSQLKIIAAVMIVTFLLSETAILAYQNVEIFNETNLSNFTSINTSPLTSSNYPNMSPNADSIISIPVDENINLSTVNNSTEKNDSESNLSVEILNETIQKINETLSENQSATETNFTVIEPLNETLETHQKTPLDLQIDLDYPRKITRGDIITAKATAYNNDSIAARNVVLRWDIPEGFEIISGDESKICGTLEPSDACYDEISLKTDTSTSLGLENIKVVVNYE